MFNFDTTFTKGKHTFKIVNNEIVEGRENLSAANGNALIRHWVDTVIKPQLLKANPSKDFDSLVKESQYLQEALSRVNYIKALNCSYGNKDKENLEIEMRTLGNDFFEKIKLDTSDFSYAEQLVIRQASAKSTDVASHELGEMYDPTTNDDSELQEWWKELNAFDYVKYGYSKESILSEKDENSYHYSSPKRSYEIVLESIERFQTILKEAGDDLVNWTDQKISLRFTKLGIKCKAYEISSYVSAYKDHLLKKGVKKVEAKANTSKGKLEDIVNKGTASVEDCFRYYKQATPSYASSVLDKLDLAHLYLLIESDLKCVTGKIYKEAWGGQPQGLSDDGEKIATLMCSLSVTKEDYKKIFKWASAKNVNLAFMMKHKDHTNLTEVTEFCKANREIPIGLLIDEDFYQTCLVRIPDDTRYLLNPALTYQYMVRMNEAEKVAMLKRISKSKSVQLRDETLYPLYVDVDYSLIKDTIINDKHFLHTLAKKIVKEDDHATMVLASKETSEILDLEKKIAIFKALTTEEKLEVLEHNAKANRQDFTGAIKNLTDEETLELLKRIIEDSRSSHYVTRIFKHFIEHKRNRANKEANKLVKAMENVDALPLDNYTMSSLFVDTKIELLVKRINLRDETYYRDGYQYYSGKTTPKKVSDSLGKTFFGDFKREDILKVYGEDEITYCEYAKFLGHLLTKEELEACVSREICNWTKDTSEGVLKDSFLRCNLDLLSYGFLKRFKDKMLFRIVVGDRRNRNNYFFGERLLKKLNVSNSIDFMFED